MPIFHRGHRSRTQWFFLVLGIVACLVVLVVGIAAVVVYRTIQDDPGRIVRAVLTEPRITTFIETEGTAEEQKAFALLPAVLGMRSPQTYLLLFMNNTELRPGGGFIGSYAVVRADQGSISILAIEGTEVLDARTPESWMPVPPEPISTYLKVDRWYFRDSNWSPSFSVNAKKALELYAAEGGVAAADIRTVVAVTPTVLEELLRLTGPLTVDGVVFDAETVTERLQHEVEVAFMDKGKTVAERKDILKSFFRALVPRVISQTVRDVGTTTALLKRLADEKQLVMYSASEELVPLIDAYALSGETTRVPHDYVRYVDANLAALKTDHAMRRAFRYAIKKNEQGESIAQATMTYRHTGGFDWRTTRYLTYARVFVPQGAILRRAFRTMPDGTTTDLATPSQGTEEGYLWFGGYTSIEPGKTAAVTFEYILPESVVPTDENPRYQLLVQKQLGTEARRLTLDIDFATVVQSANPPEPSSEWGNSGYVYATTTARDLFFSVSY